MEKTFDVEIVTPDRVFYKGTADLLEFNTESGEIGVYVITFHLQRYWNRGLSRSIMGMKNRWQQCMPDLPRFWEIR